MCDEEDFWSWRSPVMGEAGQSGTQREKQWDYGKERWPLLPGAK